MEWSGELSWLRHEKPKHKHHLLYSLWHRRKLPCPVSDPQQFSYSHRQSVTTAGGRPALCNRTSSGTSSGPLGRRWCRRCRSRPLCCNRWGCSEWYSSRPPKVPLWRWAAPGGRTRLSRAVFDSVLKFKTKRNCRKLRGEATWRYSFDGPRS